MNKYCDMLIYTVSEKHRSLNKKIKNDTKFDAYAGLKEDYEKYRFYRQIHDELIFCSIYKCGIKRK